MNFTCVEGHSPCFPDHPSLLVVLWGETLNMTLHLFSASHVSQAAAWGSSGKEERRRAGAGVGMRLQPGHDCPSAASRLSKCRTAQRAAPASGNRTSQGSPHFSQRVRDISCEGEQFLTLPRNTSPFPHSYRNPLHPSNTCSNAKSQKNLPQTSTTWAVVIGTARHLALHHLGVCNRHRRLGPKQQALISPGSGCWTSKVRVPEDFMSVGELLPGSWMAVFLLCPHVAGRELESSLGSLCKGANPIMGAPPS